MRAALPLLTKWAATCALLSVPFAGAQSPQIEQIVIDAKAATTPFPHFWEQTFGSGRAVLALRQSYREDLRTVKQATDFQSVRFHGIFNDEVGLYDPDRKTKNPGLAAQPDNDASIYNFSYVDQIYDGLLARRAPLRRAELHAQEDGRRPGSAPRILVQAERLTAEGLHAVGRDDPCLRRTPHRTLRHR